MRFSRACLRYPPPHLMSSDGIFDQLRQSWIQADKMWLIIVYGHSGTAYVNAVAHQYRPGTALVFPPGARGGHPVIGARTVFAQFQFMLQEDDRDVVALPIHSELNDTTVQEFYKKVAMVNVSFAPVQAFLWNFLWSLAEHPRMVGTDDKLLDAESYIARNLAMPLSVAEVCEAVSVPYRTLARLFEAEHGMGIQRYILQLRGREAVRLLTETSLPAKVVGAKIGVTDPHQFNKLVHRTVGLSPRAVRAQAKGD